MGKKLTLGEFKPPPTYNLHPHHWTVFPLHSHLNLTLSTFGPSSFIFVWSTMAAYFEHKFITESQIKKKDPSFHIFLLVREHDLYQLKLEIIPLLMKIASSTLRKWRKKLSISDGPWPDLTQAYFWPAVNRRPTRLWPGYFLTRLEEIFFAQREKK